MDRNSPDYSLALEPSAMKVLLNPNRHREGVVAQCVIGILVLVIGWYVIVKLIKLCDRLLPSCKPPQTNSATMYDGESMYDDVTGAAYIVIGIEPPPSPAEDCDCGNSFVIQYIIGGDGLPVITCGFVPDKEDFGAVTNYGLNNVMVQSSYNTNQLPIWIDARGVLVVGSGDFKCVVWRTTNMLDWKAVHTNRMPEGYNYEFTDGNSPKRQAFYQVEISN